MLVFNEDLLCCQGSSIPLDLVESCSTHGEIKQIEGLFANHSFLWTSEQSWSIWGQRSTTSDHSEPEFDRETKGKTFVVTSHQHGMHRRRKSSSMNQQNTTERPVSHCRSLTNSTMALLSMEALLLIICRSEAYVAPPACWWWCRIADMRTFKSARPHRSPTPLQGVLFNSSGELWLRCLERCGEV